LIFGVDAEIGAGLFLVGQIGHQADEIIDALVRDAHRARGEAAVAAAFRVGGAFEHKHAGAALARGERRAECGVAAADDDDVIC